MEEKQIIIGDTNHEIKIANEDFIIAKDIYGKENNLTIVNNVHANEFDKYLNLFATKYNKDVLVKRVLYYPSYLKLVIYSNNELFVNENVKKTNNLTNKIRSFKRFNDEIEILKNFKEIIMKDTMDTSEQVSLYTFTRDVMNIRFHYLNRLLFRKKIFVDNMDCLFIMDGYNLSVIFNTANKGSFVLDVVNLVNGKFKFKCLAKYSPMFKESIDGIEEELAKKIMLPKDELFNFYEMYSVYNEVKMLVKSKKNTK